MGSVAIRNDKFIRLFFIIILDCWIDLKEQSLKILPNHLHDFYFMR